MFTDFIQHQHKLDKMQFFQWVLQSHSLKFIPCYPCTWKHNLFSNFFVGSYIQENLFTCLRWFVVFTKKTHYKETHYN